MDTKIYSLISFASILGIALMNQNLKQLDKKIQHLKKAPIFTPQTLLEELQKNGQHIKKIFTEEDKQLKAEVFLEGLLTSPNPIKGIIDKNKEILVSLFFKDKLYSNDDQELKKLPSEINLPKKSSQIQKRSAPIFNLMDYESNKFCRINQNPHLKFIKCLQLISYQNNKQKLNIIEKIFVILGHILDFINQISGKFIKFRGINIGHQEIELGIQIKDAITVLGEVVYCTIKKNLVIKEPIYFLKDKKYLIQYLKADANRKKLFIRLLYIPLIFSLIKLILKFKNLINQYQQKKKQDQLKGIEGPIQIVNEELKCIVCINNMRNIILKPCKHLCICKQCLQLLNKKECPYCKKKIEDTVEIFIV